MTLNTHGRLFVSADRTPDEICRCRLSCTFLVSDVSLLKVSAVCLGAEDSENDDLLSSA